MKKMLLVMASGAMLVAPFAGPAAASETGLCKVGVHIHERPGYSTDPIWVETGEYEPYTDCDENPPIIIHREPICLQKPPVCV